MCTSYPVNPTNVKHDLKEVGILVDSNGHSAWPLLLVHCMPPPSWQEQRLALLQLDYDRLDGFGVDGGFHPWDRARTLARCGVCVELRGQGRA